MKPFFYYIYNFFFAFLLLLFTISNISCNNNKKVILGIDNLILSNYKSIQGKNVGILTNFSGRTGKGLLTAEVLSQSKLFNLKTIFSPEHGFYGGSHAGESVSGGEIFGVNFISLYGSSRRPKLDDLKKLDIMLIDIQDIGIRSYTFLSSVNYMLTACGEADIPVIILDRPNPIGGNVVDGSVTEKGKESFVSLIPVSYIHGMTLGEISVMMNQEGWLKNADGEVQHCDLNVIKMNNWNRNMRWEDCNLMWFPTSPQIPTADAIYGAATLGIFGELSLWNIGIGTSLPFRYLGSPDLNDSAVYNYIKYFSKDEEILIQIAHFKPFYGKYANQTCKGFIFSYPKSNSLEPYTTGIKTILAIRSEHPKFFVLDSLKQDKIDMFKKVTGGSELLDALFNGTTDSKVIEIGRKGLANFKVLRRKYFLYD